MKQRSILIACLFLNTVVFSQQWDGSVNQFNNIYRYGDISVFYNSPNRTTLGAAWGGANIGYGTGYLGFNLARNNHSDGNWTYLNDGANNGGNVMYGDIAGNLFFSIRPSTGATNGILTDVDIRNSIKVSFLNDGKVVIGATPAITAPGSYKLYVEQGILTERVKVALKTTTDWADYVFDKHYNLPSFAELEQFIVQHKHLPGVPSANEMIEQGNDLAKTDAKLLEKIEELTLYVIQINKEKENLKTQVSDLQEKINQVSNQQAQPITLEMLQQQVTDLKKEINLLRK